MDNFINYIILISFLIEVLILLKMEKVLWKTYYTPLNLLMIPYTIVLLINIALPKDLDFEPFYFPSILVWAIGLLVFFMPSLLLGIIHTKLDPPAIIHLKPPKNLRSLLWIGGFLLFASLFYIYEESSILEDLIGSEEFANTTLRGGLWGHVRTILLSILILAVFLFQKDKLIFYVLIIGTLIISVVYQVKSWIIIPIIAGLTMRLLTGKSTLKAKTFVNIAVGGIFMFFFSYFLILVVADEDGKFSLDIFDMIYKHFLFYLTSGTAGLGIDMQLGILETPNPQSIFAPFLNIFSLIDGRDLVSPINPVYLYIGWTGSNVRTFFGTLWINLGTYGTIIYVFVCASLLYGVLLWIKTKPNLWALGFYGLMTSLLFMGWFEFYYFHLIIIEIPIVILILTALMYIDKIPLRGFFKGTDREVKTTKEKQHE